jgi:hypothetical protein
MTSAERQEMTEAQAHWLHIAERDSIPPSWQAEFFIKEHPAQIDGEIRAEKNVWIRITAPETDTSALQEMTKLCRGQATQEEGGAFCFFWQALA